MQRLKCIINKIIWFVKTVTITTAIALICFLCLDIYYQQMKDLDYLSQEVRIDPRINSITMYQKARYSTIPIELADLQARLIIEVAEEEGIAVDLLVALAEQESFFDPRLISKAGATGLTQILVESHVVIDESQRHDIRYNLHMGCKILKLKAKHTDGKIKDRTLEMYSGKAHDYAENVYSRRGRYATFVDNLKEAQKVIAQN
jgi:hypothetical protein